eukprot:769274-Rhodomonas_salina.1
MTTGNPGLSHNIIDYSKIIDSKPDFGWLFNLRTALARLPPPRGGGSFPMTTSDLPGGGRTINLNLSRGLKCYGHVPA